MQPRSFLNDLDRVTFLEEGHGEDVADNGCLPAGPERALVSVAVGLLLELNALLVLLERLQILFLVFQVNCLFLKSLDHPVVHS